MNETMARSIDDFGEHIPGSRKERAHQRGTTGPYRGIAGGEPLSEAWPCPQWRRLEEEIRADDPQRTQKLTALAAARAVRDLLKTPNGRKIENQLQRMEAAESLLDIGRQLVDAPERLETARLEIARAGSTLTRTIFERGIEKYLGAGHVRDLANARYRRQPSGLWVLETSRASASAGSQWGRGTDLRAAAADLAGKLAAIAADTNAKKPRTSENPYHVRRNRAGEYAVCRRAAGGLVILREYGHDLKDLETARAAIANDCEQLDTEYRRWLNVPSERPVAGRERRPDPPPNIEPDEFTQRFGLRGVQWGNWMDGPQRRRELADAGGAFSDLAVTLGVSERMLSLGGSLGLAFGARGNGGRHRPKAHYEPNERVIAISKPSGPGSLAHEWLHALDYRLGQAARPTLGKKGLPKAASTLLRWNIDTAAPDGAAALIMRQTASTARELLGHRTNKLDLRRKQAYWSAPHELVARCFEAWVFRRLEQTGVRNNYLVSYLDPAAWHQAGGDPGEYPYPLDDEEIVLKQCFVELAREFQAADTGRVPNTTRRPT